MDAESRGADDGIFQISSMKYQYPVFKFAVYWSVKYSQIVVNC